MKWLDRKIDEFICRVRDNPETKRIPIGPNPEDPTYWRFFVIRRNRWFNVYLHHWLHDDADNLHDHRMENITLTLQREYSEELFATKPASYCPSPRIYTRHVSRLRPRFRLAHTPHRVKLYRDENGREIQCWSLFIGFPHRRIWGFWEKALQLANIDQIVWKPFSEIVSQADEPDALGYGQRRQL